MFVRSGVTVVLLLGLAGVLELGGREAARAEIQVIVSSDTNIYATGLVGLQSVVDARLRINYLDALSEREPNIDDYFRRLDEAGLPLVLTIGPRATRVAQEHLRKTPVLFSMVHAPRSFLVDDARSCGISMDISIAEYFRTLKEVRPSARKVRAFYSTADNEFLAGEGEYLDLRYGLSYSSERIDRRERLSAALRSMDEDVDAVYMISDPLYDRDRFEELSRFCKKHSIVLMTGFASLVRAGATFGITPDYGRIGVLTGEMANRILDGRSTCKQEGVGFVDQTSFYLNEEYASQSGLNVPASIKERARLTKLFNAGVNFLNADKLKSARIVFDAILERDPDNRPARSYRRLVVQRLTGARTSSLMTSARAAFDDGRFEEAVRDFRRVMDINPGHEAASRGYRQALLARSELERRRGNALASGGDPFAAIKLFQAALRTYPGNEKASRDLARTRAVQAARVPELIRSGIGYYNRREYRRAIGTFEDVLLVRPGHKQAVEYLRLSRKKQAAIEKLLRRQ